jgi:hypothetical protein
MEIRIISNYLCKGKVKGKAIELQAWTGTECSRRQRFLDFKTNGTRNDKFINSTHGKPFTPRKYPRH